MATDRELLSKGLQQLGYTIILFFLGPFVLNQAFKNQEHSLYIPVLIVGLLLAGFAIYMGFKGIRTVMRAIFND